MYRTHTCGDLRINDVNKSVTLSGWVQRIRNLGGMTFVDLRDRYGITQMVFNMETNEGTPVQIEGDSVVQHVYEMDTLFAINQENVLKKFKGYYFVNIHSKDNTWRVQKLELTKGKLVLSSINNREDLDQLKAITETTQDTVPYVFSPSKKQFKNFVKNEGFRAQEAFLKITK